jgi:hypothetical protein
MAMPVLTQKLPISVELIEKRIYVIRGVKVMLSSDLANMYLVEPRALVQAVKRNIDRFPPDFMFQLGPGEYAFLKSQSVISSWGGARRSAPYAFTEQGVAMLSSVLKSKRAVQGNVAIMRAFVRVRGILAAHRSLAKKVEALERKYRRHDAMLVEHKEVFDTLKKLIEAPLSEAVPRKGRFGFKPA